jgi:HEPN domain-containing protein
MFKLTPQDVADFCRKNKKAGAMYNQATEDYAACRCCLLNGLFPGLVLGEQAIEKMLKSILLFKNENIIKSHDIMQLSDDINKIGVLDLSKDSDLIKLLYDSYQGKYPDNDRWSDAKADRKFVTTGEVNRIDDLIIRIVNAIPIPIEVKLRMGVYPIVCDSHRLGLNTWILFNNAPLKQILPDLIIKQQQLSAFNERVRTTSVFETVSENPR